MTEPAAPETLDPLSLPLRGSRLIEASAGTGKTWTIAALYLRLVLGHGEPGAAFRSPLLPSQILVMTFTTAATRELSDRIRARLVEAAACFRGQPVADDPFLQALSDDYPPRPAREAAAWRLAMAAQSMDDASVHTIDAWCQRMLHEHAFDSGSLFDEELQPDESRLLAEAARDYWRQHVYPLPADMLAEVLKVWRHVDDLTQDVRELLPLVEPAALDSPDDDEPEVLELVAYRAEQECARRLRELKSVWIERIARMQSWIESHRGVKHGSKFNVDRALKWLRALGDWTTQESLLDPDLSPTARLRLTPADLRQQMASLPAIAVIPEEFDLFAALHQSIGALPRAGDAMRLHAARCVARRMRQSKLAAGSYSFADMLERLDAALAGERGARLRARIVEQYPVAMVDEFQDTSPLQYRLFDRLYDVRADDPETALFLIGDPKQSIYGFRGADIRSYLSARRATRGRHAALGTNFRSTGDLVDAVNQLFLQAEQRPGPGAFRFRDPAEGDALPFVPVAAQGRRDRLVDAAGPVAAMTFCHAPALLSKQEAQKQFARHCAHEIVSMLNDPQAGFVEPGHPFRRLQPADIAVLVRTGAEAEAVRRALQQRRVASVYLSDKDSVFATPEAADLLQWLKAVADPLDSRQARVAFATATIGLPLAELAQLSVDDAAFERRVDQLRHLHAVWQRQGVLAMLRQTLHRLDLPAQWLARDDGERRLTNVLHLAELLQHPGVGLEGEQALIRWFAQSMASDETGADEHIVRLESDADLVQVVTVHKSKGLEYPLVFAPFVCGFRAASPGRRKLLSVAAAGGARRVVFSPSADDIATLDEERLQEDVRLLYVALTRARHALWIGVAALKDRRSPCLFGRSAFGALMAGTDAVSEDRIGALLDAFAARSPGIVVARAPQDAPLMRLDRQRASAPLSDALRHAGGFEKNWSIGSFSSLVRDLGSLPAVRIAVDAALQEELITTPVETAAAMAAMASESDAPWHRFPRGALPGNFLHDQLEWLGEHRFSLDARPELRDRLRRRCRHQGYGAQADDVVVWLDAISTTRLPPLGVTLATLPRSLSEMEFWFPADGISAGRLDAMCRRDLLSQRPRPPLPERQLHGMLMGFADLMFEHDGRYWVLDYKSNALGTRDSDYHADALQTAMAEHRYDVQATIYLLALHRLLRSRLRDDYDPARHLGGAVYLFIRGIRGPEAGCYTMPAPLDILATLDREMAAAGEGAE